MPGFDYAELFSPGLPDPLPRFAGLPRYNFIGGHNDPTRIPADALAEAASRVLRREGPSLALYNLGQGPQGFVGLRQVVADKLARHRAIAAGAEDVIITSGSGQAIDLVCRVLLRPGDTILVEEFSYGGAIAKFRKLGLRLEAMKLDAQGIDTEALSAQLERLRDAGSAPKLIYTIPTIQNPTGSILPLGRRQALLALARAHRVPILEDECYADLVWGEASAPPALYALDPGRVIHVGSFSKTLAPALRVGYALADWSVLSRMLALKSDGGTGALEQMVVAEYFATAFDAHVRQLSATLRDKLATMTEALEAAFGTAVECWHPQGGIFLWLKLPATVDVRALVKPAMEAGLVFNPGPEWAVDGEAAKSHLRLCFALPSHETIRAGVAELARVCFERTGVPRASFNRANA